MFCWVICVLTGGVVRCANGWTCARWFAGRRGDRVDVVSAIWRRRDARGSGERFAVGVVRGEGSRSGGGSVVGFKIWTFVATVAVSQKQYGELLVRSGPGF